MYGINVGLEIGKRALLAQQYSLNITGHNIANVNTPGFTRQQAVLNSTNPMRSALGSFGTGVEITDIRRLRSVFLDQQFREESQTMGKWQTLEQGWSQVERIYNEPSETGFSTVLDDFWNSWQDLSTNPDSQAARVSVKEQASLVINAFHQFSNQLEDFTTSVDNDIVKSVGYINNMADQVAALNESIATSELTGNTANDLRDRRDYLIDELSNYVNVDTIEQSNGNFTVLVGSMALVDGNQVNSLRVEVTEQGSRTVKEVMFTGSSATPNINNGQLAGLMELRDEVLVERQIELDQLAVELVGKINELHREGYGLDGGKGRDFFDSSTTGAEDIELDILIEENDNYVAASLNGEVGDNSNALKIAGLRTSLTMNGGTASFGDFYNAIVGTVGVRTSEAANISANQKTLVFNIETDRQSVEGVSLDEEMTNMIKFEHAYSAAARVITAMDNALDTIINRMAV